MTTRLPRLALAASVAALLACTGLSGTPVPPDRHDWIGTWTGGPVTLTIEAAGFVQYKKEEGGTSSEVNAPITAWHAAGFDAGIGPVTTTFVVSDPPHPEDGVWTMTVDGQEVTRPGPVPEEREPVERPERPDRPERPERPERPDDRDGKAGKGGKRRP
jgi:hypothetical protein